MLSSDIPGKFPVPFGASAGVDFIRQIPVLSQIGVEDGAASLVDGFPPLNATPIGAGGVPPSVKDMNGILYEVTNWARWVAAGGPVFYDSAFATAIGGYPAGAVLASATVAGAFWASIANNNTTNPDAGGAGWQPLSPTAANEAEVRAGALTTKFVTPQSLALQRASGSDAYAGSDVAKLLTPAALAVLRATIGEVLAGSDAAKYITPAVLAALRASSGEVQAGTNSAKYVTPASLGAAFEAGSNRFRIGPVAVLFEQNRYTTNQVNTTFTHNYGHAFSGPAWAISMTRYDPGGGGYNQKHYIKLGNGDANGFPWRIQDDDSGNSGNYVYGFDLIAIGPA